MTISYAITVCNEIQEITKLLNFLQTNIRKEDEIVIQYDELSVTDEVKEYVTLMNSMHDNHNVIGFPLNKDFATFKNNLKAHCTKDYIFQVDADEIPHDFLVEHIGTVLDENPVDIVFVPRVNTVEGLTKPHIDKWKWNVNEKGWVNWPDYQTRIIQNNHKIKWQNKVHEQIVGISTKGALPMEEEWCLYHPKDIRKQEAQNNFYNTI